MRFSVIIATRNRPAQLSEAIESILMQSYSDTEILIVNDGSDGVHEEKYHNLENSLKGRNVTFFELEKRPRGHGAAGSRNYAALFATGNFFCFLDDDDTWTDPEHLNRANRILSTSPGNVDIVFTNQQPFQHGEAVDQSIWLNNLPKQVNRPLVRDKNGGYLVTAADLMNCPGFAHLNTTIISQRLFKFIDGFDESARYEEDRDLYLRAIDIANRIYYLPTFTARHNIPDPAPKTNVTTLISNLEKYVYQCRMLDKAILFSKTDCIRRHAKLHKAFTQKKIAQLLEKQRRFDVAAFYAREALLIGFNFKWLLYASYLTVRAILKTAPKTKDSDTLPDH